jgi:hypothetical protein
MGGVGVGVVHRRRALGQARPVAVQDRLRPLASVLSFGGYGMVPGFSSRRTTSCALVSGVSSLDRSASSTGQRRSPSCRRRSERSAFRLALPGFANGRAPGALEQAYLNAISTSAQCNGGLLLLVLLADPIVYLLLSSQWTGVSSVRIVAVAYLANFPGPDRPGAHRVGHVRHHGGGAAGASVMVLSSSSRLLGSPWRRPA